MKFKNTIVIAGALMLALVIPTMARAVDIKLDTSADVSVTTAQANPNAAINAGTKANINATPIYKAVDALIAKVEAMPEGDFCAQVSDAVVSLSKTDQTSLAWKADSYSKNLSLGVSANATAEEKAEYESLRTAYTNINAALVADGTLSANDEAAIRAAYLELMTAYRNGGVDEARASKIRAFIHDASACIKDNASIKSAVASAGVAGEASLTVTREDLIEDDFEFDVPFATTVKTASALRNFIAISIAHNDNIESVVTDDNQTEVKYKQPGKLLGFIPVKMRVKTTVHADGTAKVSYPWYKFATHAVGGKVTSETVLETAKLTAAENLSVTSQAIATDATIKAFVSKEKEKTTSEETE